MATFLHSGCIYRLVQLYINYLDYRAVIIIVWDFLTPLQLQSQKDSQFCIININMVKFPMYII